GARERSRGDVASQHALGAPGKVKCKGALKREAVKRSTSSVVCRGDSVLALIQKSSGLLTFDQIDKKPNTGFFDDQLAGLAKECAARSRQTFEFSDSRLVALDYCARLITLGQQLHPKALQRIHSLRQRLDYKAIGVAIYDQRWEQIALCIDQPEGG